MNEPQAVSNEEDLSEYAFILKTVQTSAIRVLIEAIKEIITDANIIISKQGLKIMTMDPSHTILIHLKLQSDKFEKFYCEKDMTIGISMLCLFKLIKIMSNNDTLTLYVEKDDINRLGIRIENGEKNSLTNFKLNLMDLPKDYIDIPPASFESVLTMPSNDFQKICLHT